MIVYNDTSVTEQTRVDGKQSPVLLPDLASDEVRFWFQAINFAVICELIDVLGSVANIINIICFCKQGFKDSVNISLLGLAVSDLGSLLTLVWQNLCFNELFHQADLPFESMEVQYLTGGWPHNYFTRVTSWITAFITLERCLCIVVPLKVKTMITPKRVTVIIVSMSIVLLGCVSPIYYTNRLAFKFYPEKNKTLLGLVHTSDQEKVDKVSFAVNNLFIPFTSFLAVIICTIILVVKLKGKTKWRQQSTAPGNSDSLSSRDQRVSKMVVMISSLFIVCFTPVTIIFIAIIIWPELSIDGRYRNMFIIVFTFAFIMESANSSINIFIYYRMSSKFRAVFRELFRLDKNEDKNGDKNRDKNGDKNGDKNSSSKNVGKSAPT